ncbi:uncharacterized protein LOC111713649 isoform X2 [Eurytemora carolleeae]|uniref:uncharacterized protein LOC111713649 isoform X2 n=1 Tax=Eurytemora carolleeae TaxID=1294199 RepID=UPI000C78EB1F|nr:uncharacterized protein LOC111713649 isoform X2 [Eurytemora carolleeae]|eukprot:XP_023344338.1 uncharacterized protein LOC111713649 isoform X2 [Eurytemora affinis]
MENKDLLAERKAKLAQLRGELYVHDRDITSAPSLTVVDEFQEDFSAADRRSGLVDGGKQGQIDEHKIFYAEINSRKESDFEFNNLINEANRRGGKDQGSGKASEDFRNGKNSGSFADDTDNDEDSFSSRPNSKGNSSSGSEGISSSLSQQFSTDKSLNLGSSITKVYQNGKYINSNEDQGYQSSASSPNETKRNRTKENRTGRSENGLLKVERGVDNLSQSLPETFLKSVKVDLSQSVNGTQDKSRSKVVYDPRIFGTAPDSSVPTIAEDDVEKDYFNKMNVFNGKDSDRKPHKEERKNSFRQFLSESFKDGTQEMKPTQESLQRKESRRTNLHLAPVPEGHRVIGEPSPLECIDLGDPVYSGSKDGSKTARSRSPTLSCKTEFTDPDHRGRSGLRRSRGSKGFSLKIPGLKKKVDIGQCGSRKRRPSLDGSEFGESWNYRPTPCETCSHRKTSTCYGVLALLAVDVLTICLILILFNKMHHHYEGLGLVQGRIGEFPDRHRHPEQQWGPEGRLDPEKIQGDQGNIGDQGYTGDLENQTNPHVNFTLDPDQGIDEKQISPRSLEPRTAPGLSRSSSYSGNKPLIVGRWMNIQPPPDVILSNSIDVGAREITSEPTPVSDKPSISLRFANQFMSENSMPSPSPRLATNEETRTGSVQDKSNQIVFPSDPILSLQPLSFNQKSRSTTTSDTSSSPTTPPGVFTPNPNLESIDRSIDSLESQMNRTLNSEKDEESKLPELNYSTPSFPTPSSVTRPSLSEISGYPYLRSIAPRPTQPSDSSSERLEQTTSGLPTQDTTDNSSTTSTTTTTTTTTTTITTPTTTTTTTTTTTQPPSTQKPVDPDLVEELRQKLENLTAQVNAMVMPPTFSCHRTTSVKDESIITYNACSIQTPGMNARTGRFRVEQDGVYQFTFTGLFVAVRGHMLSVDLFLERSGGSRPEIIGRSSGMVKEDTVFGRDDDLHATTSVIIFQRLNKNDEVYVAMLIDGTKGDSHLQSDFSKKIHFTGLKISN